MSDIKEPKKEDYGGTWRVNPWSTRFLVRDILEKIGISVPKPDKTS
jgi:hypothetical protein